MSRLVRLYPRPWRERYGDEFESLIAERPPGPADVLDIVRGALDAHLNPVVGHAERTPWTHRLPGLLALSAGLTVTAAAVAIAFGSGPNWGPPGDLIGIAFVLMLISVPGDYAAPFGGRVAVALGFVVLGVGIAPATRWSEAAVAVALLAEVVALCGLVTLAAIRAGFSPRGRWLLLAWAVLTPAAAIGAHALVRAVTGNVLVPDGSRIAALIIVPYGLAWLIVGLRMTVRGAPTIIDASDHPAQQREVQTA